MGFIQPTALYLALVTLLTLRYIAGSGKDGDPGPRRAWLRDAVIAMIIGAAGHLVPTRSALMSMLMLLAYLVGFMVLTMWLHRRWGRRGGSVAGQILLAMVCLLVAMVAMALPILLLARLGLP